MDKFMILPIARVSGDGIPHGEVEVITIEDLIRLREEEDADIILTSDPTSENHPYAPMLLVYDGYME